MEYVILGLLLIRPATLYTLNKCFEQGISLFFSPSLGSIQNAVKRLDEKGFIATEEITENGRAKKMLTILPSGEHAFMEWMESPLDLKNLEVAFLSRLYFLGLIPQDSKKITLLEGMLGDIHTSKNTLDETAVVLDGLDLPDSQMDVFKYQRKVLDYGIDTHACAITWIQGLLEEIRNQEKSGNLDSIGS